MSGLTRRCALSYDRPAAVANTYTSRSTRSGVHKPQTRPSVVGRGDGEQVSKTEAKNIHVPSTSRSADLITSADAFTPVQYSNAISA